MPLPTKEQIDWSNPSNACPLPTTTGNQKNDCKTGLNYTTCTNTVNGFITNRNTQVDQEVTNAYNAKTDHWQNKNGEYQSWADRENSLKNERRPYAVDGDQGCGNDCGAGWEKYGDHRGCGGKNNRQIDCKRSAQGIQDEMRGWRDAKPTKPTSPVIASISAKATDCCMNETNIINSKIDNSKITQTCIKDGKTITQEVESSGNQITTSGAGSTLILNSSSKSSSDQQQYMIIAIVIISIILSSSVLLLLLVS